MLGAVFSFRGRINRLQYFAGCVGLGVGMVLLALLIVGGAVASGNGDKAALLKAGLFGILFLVLGVPVYCWISFSLQARRFRDIGWEPVFVIPAWIGFDMLDQFLALGAPQIAVIPGMLSPTWLGVAVNLGLSLCLLFWPGRNDFDIAGVFDGEPEPTRSPPRATPAPVAPRMSIAPRPATTAPAGFGRRGL